MRKKGFDLNNLGTRHSPSLMPKDFLYFLGAAGSAVVRSTHYCPSQETEMAKALIADLLTRKGGRWLWNFLFRTLAMHQVKSFFGMYSHAVTIVEFQFFRGKEATKAARFGFELRWGDQKTKTVRGEAFYVPYEEPQWRKIGEALLIFVSPEPTTVGAILKHIASEPGLTTIYVPPTELFTMRWKYNRGEYNDILAHKVRPFLLWIKGTVYEIGDYRKVKSWGTTIDGPNVSWLV